MAAIFVSVRASGLLEGVVYAGLMGCLVLILEYKHGHSHHGNHNSSHHGHSEHSAGEGGRNITIGESEVLFVFVR